MKSSLVVLKQGTDWTREWDVDNALNQAVPLTGASVMLQVRDLEYKFIHEASTHSATPQITLIPAEGRIVMAVPAADTKDFAPGSYLFELELTYADGRIEILESSGLQVIASLIEDVTP